MARTFRQRMRPRGEARRKLHQRLREDGTDADPTERDYLGASGDASEGTRRMIIVFVLLVLAIFAFGQFFG